MLEDNSLIVMSQNPTQLQVLPDLSNIPGQVLPLGCFFLNFFEYMGNISFIYIRMCVFGLSKNTWSRI